MNENPLIALAGYFALLSLFAVGGANAAIPEMHRIAVEVMHWMSDRQFADSFAISQVSPGPNIIIVTLIGYHVAGLAGAAVATAAMCGPTCVLAFVVARTWDRFKEARWRVAIRARTQRGPQYLCRWDYCLNGASRLCDAHQSPVDFCGWRPAGPVRLAVGGHLRRPCFRRGHIVC